MDFKWGVCVCERLVWIGLWFYGSSTLRSGEDRVWHLRVSLDSFTATWFLGLSSHPQELLSYTLKSSIWRESEGYHWFKSLMVTGRGVEPTTYRSGSECPITEMSRFQLKPAVLLVQYMCTIGNRLHAHTLHDNDARVAACEIAVILIIAHCHYILN
jgi:hypothetical protein